MISGKTKILAAVVVAAALLATVAVARTVHTHATAVTAHTTNGQAIGGQTTGMSPGQMAPSGRHGNFACAAAIEQDCQQLDWWPE